MTGCGVVVRSVQTAVTNAKSSPAFHQGRVGPLTDKEKGWAKIAWGYFERNYNPETGLVNSIDQYPSTTMWNTGDYLAALISAYELELLSYQQFDARFSKLLEFLNEMDLFHGRVPNKAYHTQTGKMVNFENKPSEEGWSSIDAGRLLIWLMIARSRFPEFSEFIDRALLRWNFCDLIDDCGTMFSGVQVEGEKKLYQEGRLGYEEYAAYGYQLMGLDTSRASSLMPSNNISLYGIQLPHDGRDWREFGAFAPILSGPYILHGLEFNWDLVDDPSTKTSSHSNREIADIAERIYQVQQARYDNERLLTARTDHQLNRAPYFVFDSIYAAGYPWSTLSDDGNYHDELALIATKAVFGLWALWNTPYTDRLMKVTESLVDENKGWLEGRYEENGRLGRNCYCINQCNGPGNAFV